MPGYIWFMTLTAMSATIVFSALCAFSLLLLSEKSKQYQRQTTIAFAVATGATCVWIANREWDLGLPTALLASILAAEIAFFIFLIKSPSVLTLGVLLGPYLLIASGLVVWADAVSDAELVLPKIDGWLSAHIGAAILGYGFITLAAIASAAIIFRERALKRRTRGKLIGSLPAVLIAEWTEIGSLTAAEMLLGLAILCGIGAEYAASGTYFQLTHKSLLSIIAFVIIGLLLWLHLKMGIRGRLAARIGVSVYLLISLGYLGVKFIGEYILVSGN